METELSIELSPLKTEYSFKMKEANTSSLSHELPVTDENMFEK